MDALLVSVGCDLKTWTSLATELACISTSLKMSAITSATVVLVSTNILCLQSCCVGAEYTSGDTEPKPCATESHSVRWLRRAHAVRPCALVDFERYRVATLVDAQ